MNTVAGLASPSLTVYAPGQPLGTERVRRHPQSISATAAAVSILSKVILDVGILEEADPGIWVAGVVALARGLARMF